MSKPSLLPAHKLSRGLRDSEMLVSSAKLGAEKKGCPGSWTVTVASSTSTTVMLQGLLHEPRSQHLDSTWEFGWFGVCVCVCVCVCVRACVRAFACVCAHMSSKIQCARHARVR
jgi:hypothetical protein